MPKLVRAAYAKNHQETSSIVSILQKIAALFKAEDITPKIDVEEGKVYLFVNNQKLSDEVCISMKSIGPIIRTIVQSDDFKNGSLDIDFGYNKVKRAMFVQVVA